MRPARSARRYTAIALFKWQQPAGANRSPSPRRDDRERARSRSRSPVRMETDRRDERRDDRRDERRGDDNRGRAAEQNPGNNLHVSSLSLKVEERDLEAAFSKYGRIQKVQVMRDPHTKESRGFAFVMMETAEEAEAAIAGLSGTELIDRTINVDKARRGRARTPTPGAYHGPPKREAFGGRFDRPYEPRGYSSGGYDRYDDRYDSRRAPSYGGGRGGYDDRDRYGGGRGYDDRDRAGYAIPMRDDRRYDDRGSSRYDDRDRYGGSSRSSGYDDRRRY
ncbi:hypothetical protein JCM10908_002364 [Rhodotorula pacifica]|uniref:RNA recognition motif domain-containing protein n=1 Tax=Rhodotorula pacifica TaxID=1495444 RepID=UPI0031782C1F